MNRLGLTDQQELSDYELEISTARSTEPLPAGALNFAHYKSIHHHLFQDVYDWAGKVRTVRLSKAAIPFAFQSISNLRRLLFSIG